MDTQQPRLHVTFFVEPVEDLNATREQGRPIFKDREFVRIRFPGDNKRELVAPANDRHYVHGRGEITYAEQYPEHYEAFRRESPDQIVGTRVEVLPFLRPHQVAELKALNIHTAEVLADLDDRAIKKLGMGGRDLVEQAKAYLAKSGDVAERDALLRRIADLEARVPKADPDPFEGFDDEDLKNMIRDAGGSLPQGRPSRARLIETLQTMKAEAA